MATFLSVGIVNLGQLMFSSKILNVPLKSIFHWGRLLKIFVLNLALALAVYAGVMTLDFGTNSNEILICIVIGIVWMCAYFAFMFRRLKSIWREINVSEDA